LDTWAAEYALFGGTAPVGPPAPRPGPACREPTPGRCQVPSPPARGPPGESARTRRHKC
jgi:hypothetical protein